MLSRVADCLFWMSRYVERAENNARILDVNLQLMLDFEGQSEIDVRRHWSPIINSLEEHDLFHTFYQHADSDSVVEFVTFEAKNPNSILSCLSRARENARSVREQISSEMWEHINMMYLFIRSDEARELFRSSPYQFYKRVLEGSFQFLGITDATMTHGEGWDFIQLGKFIERADRTSRILDVKYHILLPSGERVGGNVDTVQWMAVLALVQRAGGVHEALRRADRPVEGGGVFDPARLLPARVAALRASGGLRATSHQRRAGGSSFTNEAERLSGKLRSDLDYTAHRRNFPDRPAPVPRPDATAPDAAQRRGGRNLLRDHRDTRAVAIPDAEPDGRRFAVAIAKSDGRCALEPPRHRLRQTR